MREKLRLPASRKYFKITGDLQAPINADAYLFVQRVKEYNGLDSTPGEICCFTVVTLT